MVVSPWCPGSGSGWLQPKTGEGQWKGDRCGELEHDEAVGDRFEVE
jgi:hypothetical protein